MFGSNGFTFHISDVPLWPTGQFLLCWREILVNKSAGGELSIRQCEERVKPAPGSDRNTGSFLYNFSERLENEYPDSNCRAHINY